jgi:hypothetical protein
MNQKLALIIFAFAFAVAVIAGFFSPHDEKPSPSDFRAKLKENLPSLVAPSSNEEPKPAAPSKKTPSSATTRDPASVPTAAQQKPLREEDFARKYSEGLKFSFVEGGHLARIEGAHLNPSELQGSNRVPGFRPSSSSDLQARADEIFRDASEMLGVTQGGHRFVGPELRPGETTGQAFYQQAIDGVPLYPGGVVSIVIGPDGEIRALDSSIHPKVQVLNSATLAQPADSRKILYVTESAPVALLRYAYETRDKGIQRITDAQTGDLLLERNQKIH